MYINLNIHIYIQQQMAGQQLVDDMEIQPLAFP